MNEEQALVHAKRLAAAFPNQHIGESTITEMAHELTVVDEDMGDRLVNALKGQSAWFPTPFDVRKVVESFKEGHDMARLTEFERDIVTNVARVRNISYTQALALRRAAAEDYLQEALDCNLESAGYWALKVRVLKDMEARVA